MKNLTLFLALLAGLAPAAGRAAAEVRTVGHATVEFFEPEKFTDVRDSYLGEASRTTYLEQIRDYLLERAKYYVPDGHTLAVTITDVDMAGDFEPWLGPRWSDIRIVKDIYPPRIDLAFRLTDASGHVVKQGRRELRDLAFLMKITMAFRDDSVRHEKALLDDWLRAEFPRVRKN